MPHHSNTNHNLLANGNGGVKSNAPSPNTNGVTLLQAPVKRERDLADICHDMEMEFFSPGLSNHQV